ncbi:MAG: cupin-like domain-containing protein [Oculatellaceae cyanobacterium Prado106]|nr:cupin-like domain-containing protein [Oculatellaceae cyanobacterium Prado106]
MQQLFFEGYQREGIPVVIAGLLGNMNWNLEYLSQTLKDVEFPVRFYGRERYEQDKREWKSIGSGVAVRTLTFCQYAELLRSGEAAAKDIYLARCALVNTPLATVPIVAQAEAQLGLKFPVIPLSLWVGPGGHTSCLHYDPMDGVLMQMHGSKRILLFPPSQLYNLYPFSVWKHLRYGLKHRAVYSQVYPDRPDYAAFPKFKQALEHCYEVILNPGEMLFIPAGWWHEVTTLGDGMVCSVNRWWHVYPIGRSLRSWSKWRAHFGSLLATPHIVWNLLSALQSDQVTRELSQLLQRL